MGKSDSRGGKYWSLNLLGPCGSRAMERTLGLVALGSLRGCRGPGLTGASTGMILSSYFHQQFESKTCDEM